MKQRGNFTAQLCKKQDTVLWTLLIINYTHIQVEIDRESLCFRKAGNENDSGKRKQETEFLVVDG